MIYLSSQQKNKGYTLLFSVLVSSLLLAIGLAILTISKKELLLSSAGRESQFAFYAADTGAECALYWDLGNGRAAFDQKRTTDPAPTISCNGQNIAMDSVTVGPQPAGVANPIRFVFKVYLDPSKSEDKPCAVVTVDKRYDLADNPLKTIIQSRGYNTGCNTTDDPRKVERGLQVSY